MLKLVVITIYISLFYFGDGIFKYRMNILLNVYPHKAEIHTVNVDRMNGKHGGMPINMLKTRFIYIVVR